MALRVPRGVGRDPVRVALDPGAETTPRRAHGGDLRAEALLGPVHARGGELGHGLQHRNGEVAVLPGTCDFTVPMKKWAASYACQDMSARLTYWMMVASRCT